MNEFAMYLTDSATMLRRNVRHMRRYPMIFFIVGIPIVLMLLFVYVFGGTLGAGLGGVTGGRAEYVAYVTPGILLITVAGAAQGTAIAVAMDMKEGILARFRTMPISRASFLSGHVLANVAQTMLGVAIVVAVAVAIGFRATTGPVEWILAAGLLSLTALALTWVSVALGLVSRSVETASNLPMPLFLLPFLGAGSSRRTRCRIPCAGSPKTSRSRRSWRRCDGCSSAARSAAPARSPSPGVSRSPCSGTYGRGGCTIAIPHDRWTASAAGDRPR